MNRRTGIASLIALLVASAVHADSAAIHTITQQELQQRTQALVDAIVPGDSTLWKAYYADDCTVFDEKGRGMNKTELLADLQPMPKGYSGSIRIVPTKSWIINDTAIFSYDMDEKETIWGQELRARYHQTDTWMYRAGSWQIVASQVLRYYEDPAVGVADPALLATFAGTYELSAGNTATVSVGSGKLYLQRGERPKEELLPETSEIFFRKGVEGRRLFRKGAGGRIEAMIDRRNNEDVVWRRKS